jgi:hypothetical protein
MCLSSDLRPDLSFATTQLVKDGTELRKHITVYLVTLQKICIRHAYFANTNINSCTKHHCDNIGLRYVHFDLVTLLFPCLHSLEL